MVRFQVKKRAVKTKIRPQWETQQAWERDTHELQEETAVIYEAVKVSPSRASLLCFLLLFLLLICFDRVEHSCVPSRHIIFRALKPSQPRKVAEAVHLRRSSGRFTSTGASVFTPFSWSEDLLFSGLSFHTWILKEGSGMDLIHLWLLATTFTLLHQGNVSTTLQDGWGAYFMAKQS